jgi:hypothetical protein
VAERQKYYKHRRKARANPDKYLSLIVDGMDQAKTKVPKPSRATSQTKNLEGLGWNVVGVLSHGHEPRAQAFMFPGQHPKDSSTTLQIILDTIKRIKDSRGAKGLPPVLYLQVDNCGSENKNSTVMAGLAALVENGTFEKVGLPARRFGLVDVFLFFL